MGFVHCLSPWEWENTATASQCPDCGLWPVSSEEGTGGLFSSSETSWDPRKADVLEGSPVEEWLAVLFQKQPTGRKAEEYRWGTDSLKNVVPTLGLRALSTQVYNW